MLACALLYNRGEPERALFSIMVMESPETCDLEVPRLAQDCDPCDIQLSRSFVPSFSPSFTEQETVCCVNLHIYRHVSYILL